MKNMNQLLKQAQQMQAKLSTLQKELAEREVLRKEYLAHFRSHFKSRLENIKVVSPEEYEQEMKNKKN